MIDGACDPDENWYRAPCGLVIADAAGIVGKANRIFCTWLGYRPQDIEGVRKFTDFLPMGARIFHQTHWAPLLEIQGSVSEVQLDMVHRDGHRVPMLLNVVRRKLGASYQDEMATFVATDRKKYERELVRASERAQAAEAQLRLVNEELGRQDRAKDRFLATLAHELRNPLAPLANGLQVLKLRPNDAALWHKTRVVFERQVGQLAHLVDDLLEVSRITQGKLELRKAELALLPLLEASIEAALPSASAARLHLRLTPPSGEIRICADPTRMTQIISNLLNNAVKFTAAGGSIHLGATAEDGMAVIEVRDTGMGIAADQLGSIFEMFSQISAPGANVHGGLGIGLALVKGLAELHGGTVRADSAGLGYGSTFRVSVPLSSVAPAAARPGQAGTPRQAGRRVLVVDDNVDAAETLSMALALMGHSVAMAHDGAGALRMVEQFAPDCVLLDVGLPDFSGHEVARRIRAAEAVRQLVLVAVTGWGQQSDKQAARDAGFDTHVTKPVDFGALDALLSALFGAG